MNARDNILKRLRSGQANQHNAASRSQLPALPRLAAELRKARFMELMRGSHGDIIECTEQNWPQQLATLLAERHCRHLLMGDSHANRDLQTRLQADLPTLDVRRYQAAMLAPEADDRNQEALSSVRQEVFTNTDAGFSRAIAALGETGSLVVKTGPQEPRTVSLVPPLSIVLVHEQDLLSGVGELLEQPCWNPQEGGQMPTNLLLISGPSKTADIQQTLAYGAHGPKELVVLWVVQTSSDV
jgi:L-lactate dehydrogenase complex protein LldG